MCGGKVTLVLYVKLPYLHIIADLSLHPENVLRADIYCISCKLTIHLMSYFVHSLCLLSIIGFGSLSNHNEKVQFGSGEWGRPPLEYLNYFFAITSSHLAEVCVRCEDYTSALDLLEDAWTALGSKGPKVGRQCVSYYILWV